MSDQTDPKILSDNLFPVVGVGASAGGLEAFKQLLQAIPEQSGMAYVLVQHLAPDHESLLPAILQKFTPIPVIEITDEIAVRPNHIYILPSNKVMVANDGVLQLSPRSENRRQPHLPIDLFFHSLAEVHQAHAIGVILTGTGSDGTLGLSAIKERGGITVVQSPHTAAYDGMPGNAVQAGVVDFALPLAEIPPNWLSLPKPRPRPMVCPPPHRWPTTTGTFWPCCACAREPTLRTTSKPPFGGVFCGGWPWPTTPNPPIT